MKQEKGITIISLAIIIIILVIITGVGIQVNTPIIGRADREELKTQLMLIQAKWKIEREQVNFNGTSTLDESIIIAEGENKGKLKDQYKYSTQGEDWVEIETEYYKLPDEALESMGLEIENNQGYLVNYKNNEIIYVLGYEDEEGNIYYKLSQINPTNDNTDELDYTKEVKDLGIPLISKYPNDILSRNVWDMQLYNNRIYIGAGDYDKNTGPVDVYYLDLETEEFVKEGSVDDEQINRYVVIDNQLIITGTDPREGWDYGSYHVWNDNSWTKNKTLLGAIHNFDLVKYHDKLFAGIGNDSDTSIVMSTDNGETFSYVYMYDDESTKLEVNSTTSGQYRVYDLIVFKDKLYAFCNYKLYEYIEEENIFLKRSLYQIYYGSAPGLYYVPLKTKLVYDDKLILINGSIKYTENLDSFTTVGFNETTYAYDALTIDGELYVLCDTPVDDRHVIKVYKTTDCQKWDLVMYFNYKDFARSFEYANGTFYFGIGTIKSTTIDGANSGRILKAKLK